MNQMEFDMGILKFMPAFECLKEFHQDRLRQTEDSYGGSGDGEKDPTRGGHRLLAPTSSATERLSLSPPSPLSPSPSSSLSASSSLSSSPSPSLSRSPSSPPPPRSPSSSLSSPSKSPSSSRSPPSLSSEEYYSCASKALADNRINTWITSKVSFMPTATPDHPFDKSSSRRLRTNRDNIFGPGTPDVDTVLKLGRETMRAPFAASTAADVLMPVAGDRKKAAASAIVADALIAGQRKKRAASTTVPGSVLTAAHGLKNRESSTAADVSIAASEHKKATASTTGTDVSMAAGENTAAGTEPGNRRVTLLSLSFPASPRSEYFWGFGDW